MITGMHAIIDSIAPDLDRAFFRDVLNFPLVDAGGGWLIFALPPAELALHPAEANDRHELYLMCDDIEAEVARLRQHNVVCSAISNEGWGLLTTIRLPGGGELGLYEPRHALAHAL